MMKTLFTSSATDFLLKKFHTEKMFVKLKFQCSQG